MLIYLIRFEDEEWDRVSMVITAENSDRAKELWKKEVWKWYQLDSLVMLWTARSSFEKVNFVSEVY